MIFQDLHEMEKILYALDAYYIGPLELKEDAARLIDTLCSKIKAELSVTVSSDNLCDTSDCSHARDYCRQWDEGLALLDALYQLFSMREYLHEKTSVEEIVTLRRLLERVHMFQLQASDYNRRSGAIIGGRKRPSDKLDALLYRIKRDRPEWGAKDVWSWLASEHRSLSIDSDLHGIEVDVENSTLLIFNRKNGEKSLPVSYKTFQNRLSLAAKKVRRNNPGK